MAGSVGVGVVVVSSVVLLFGELNDVVEGIILPCVHLVILSELDDDRSWYTLNDVLDVLGTVDLSEGSLREVLSYLEPTAEDRALKFVDDSHISVIFEILLKEQLALKLHFHFSLD